MNEITAFKARIAGPDGSNNEFWYKTIDGVEINCTREHIQHLWRQFIWKPSRKIMCCLGYRNFEVAEYDAMELSGAGRNEP